ncbi:MAG: GAF domain-containing protein [Candidatus Berkelbacteria bacterium]|nr:GAF domain-containing protein [Candidatus Berkelbacteria bacterium]
MASKAPNLDALWQPLFSEILKIMAVDAGTIMFLGEGLLIRKVARGMGEDIMNEPPIPEDKGGISWQAVHARKPVVENDLSKSHVASKALAAGQFHALITVPMMVRDQVVGVISIFARKERNFSGSDVNLFSVIANQSALAIISIQSTELLKENRKRLDEFSALNQISQSVATLFNFEETLLSIIATIAKQMNGDKGVLVLFDHNEKLLKAVKPAFNLTEGQVRDFRTRTDEGITGQAFCKGVPQIMETVDSVTSEVLKRANLQDVKSVLAAPLKVKSQTLGVLHIFSSKEKAFHNDDLRLFGILSSQAAVVVSSSYMYRQIEEERKKDESLLSSIGEGVLAVDTTDKIILLNKAGEKLTGYLHEEIINQNATSLLDGEKNGNKMIKRRDGTAFPARISSAPIYDADDKVIGKIIAFSDMTHDLEVEQMKQELISIATHELRTPITGIKGYLDMVLEGDTGGVNDETKETIQDMAGITQKLADLVDDLLNVGRIEQGRIEVKPVPMDLGQFTSDIIKELSIQAKQKNLELVFQTPQIPQVKADPDRTRQILINLIGNAIKYTEKGSVTVSIETSKIPNHPNSIITHVKDTGLGMSKEGQAKLFSKFYRVKTEKTRSITGTGLGLWITKKIVEMMGGKIWVESVEGKGSTFSFSLPVVK